jgi:hypothetical protein
MNIVTFYNKIIKKEVVLLQKKVFNKFGYDINQIYVDNWKSHGDSINEYLKSFENEDEIIFLFDIDSIPLNDKILDEILLWCKNNIGIVGIAQNAPKKNDYIIYASPAFMAFSIKTYNFLNKPSFLENDRSDCGTEMTHRSREYGVEVRLFYPTKYEQKTFKLDGYIHYGYGCNYENKIYHSFESRFGKKDSFFINKCNSILNNG